MAEAPLRVLVVDDEAPARRRLRELLDDCASVLPLSMTMTGMPASAAAFTDFSSAVASGMETTSPWTFWVTAASIMRDIATMSVVCGA